MDQITYNPPRLIGYLPAEGCRLGYVHLCSVTIQSYPPVDMSTVSMSAAQPPETPVKPCPCNRSDGRPVKDA